mgnify:CR=1 FL=1
MTPGERLALLKKEQGSLAKVLATENETTYLIYTDNGDIVYKSTKPPTEDAIGDNELATLKTTDCKIIDENKKGMGQFSIDKDEHGVCAAITVTIHANTIKKNTTEHNLKFYATEKGDPHFVIDQFLIDGTALHKTKKVTIPHTLTDVADISIYTSKIYDKYVRV